MFERILYSALLKITPEKRKVYDCFLFFNELEMLELRFSELYDYVDKFVLVEATTTHQSNPKPLHFQDNREKFKAFYDKIIHVVVDDLPASSDAMTNERYQRNCIFRGLTHCVASDIIIVSDVDEIPTPESINYYRNNKLYDIRKLDQQFSYYFINYIANIRWSLAFISSYHNIKNNDLTKIRRSKVKPRKVLPNGGWHFSYLGGIDKIITKLEAFSHADLNTAQYKDKDWLINCLNRGEDLFERNNLRYEPVLIDDSFPKHVVENVEYYKQIGWIR